MKHMIHILIFFSILLAISNVYAGRAEMIYDAGKNPAIQSCTPNRNLLTEEFFYSKKDIIGPIPYSRTYQTALSESWNNRNFIFNAFKSIGGWNDNFDHYLIVSDEGTSPIRVIFRFKTMGESDETFYIASLNGNRQIDQIRRIFASSPLEYEAWLRIGSYKGDGIGTDSINHRDKQLVLEGNSNSFSSGKNVNNVKNLSFTLYQQGNKYTIQYINSFGNDAVYKITKAELETGQILQFKYNVADASLARVVDQYGNFLVFERNQIDADISPVQHTYPTAVYAGTFSSNTPNDYLNRILSSAELAADKIQKATYTYLSYDWKNFGTNQVEKIYVPVSATTTNNGTENYTYVKVVPRTYLPSILASNNFYAPEYHVPALSVVSKRFFDSSRFTYIDSQILNFDYVRDKGAPSNVNWWTRTGRSKNQGYQDIGLDYLAGDITSFNINYSTVFYGDNVKNKDFEPMNFNISGNIKSQNILYKFNGFPCMTYHETPIKEAESNVLYSQFNYIIDKNGNRTNFSYDDQGRLKTVTEAVGTTLQRITTYTYSSDIRRFTTPIRIESPDKVIVNTLNTTGQVTRTDITTTNGGGSQTKTYRYEYINGLLSKTIYPDNSVKTINYMAMGAKKSSEIYTKNNQAMTTFYANYNSAGEAGLITQPNGVVTSIIFDSYNQPIKIVETDPVKNKTKFKNMAYDNMRNLLISEQDSDYVSTSYEYDANGVLKSKNTAGLTNEYSYNSMGQIIFENKGIRSGPFFFNNQRIYAHLYNRLGQVNKTVQGGDDSKYWSTFTYDGNGNITTITKPGTSASTVVEKNGYDQLNRKVNYTDALGKVYQYSYDNLDNATLQQAANSSRSTSTYNDQDLKTEINSDFGSKSYTYDLVSNPLSAQHQSRLCRYISYDVLDYYKQLNCQNSDLTTSALDVNYNFDYHQSRFGRLDQVVSNNFTGISDGQYKGGNTYYTYDSFDRVSSKEQRVGRLQSSLVIKPLMMIYDYTDEGRLKSITYPSGKTVTYKYSIYPTLSTGNPLITGMNIDHTALSLSYYNDLIQKITWANGNSSTYSYDGAENISKIVNIVGNNEYANHSYTYYNNGLLQQAIIAGLIYTYQYDAKGQLISESRSGGYTHTYSYDSNGNRLSFNSTGNGNPYPFTSAAYTYTASQNRFASLKHNNVNQAFSYLATGEFIFPQGSSSYDYLGRRSWEAAQGVYAAQAIEYNHKNERIYTTRTGLIRQYLYDEAGHLIGEYNSNGQAIVEYVWLHDQPIAAMYPNGKVIQLLTDRLNTPRRGIDSSDNAVVWSWDPDAFGVRGTSIANVEMNLRFAGQYYDRATSLHYNLNRYYNPVLGRYMEADPIGLEGGWNPYAYAGNDPVNNVDPEGLNPVLLVLGIVFTLDSIQDGAPPVAKGAKVADAVATGFKQTTLSQSVKQGMTDVAKNKSHGNKIDSRPATLYEKYDKNGKFLKHGITKHENPSKRYTAKEIDGGTVVRTDRGPRNEIIQKERDLVERTPGPQNRERWAGKRLGE